MQAFDGQLFSIRERQEVSLCFKVLLGQLHAQGAHICYFSPHKLMRSERRATAMTQGREVGQGVTLRGADYESNQRVPVQKQLSQFSHELDSCEEKIHPNTPRNSNTGIGTYLCQRLFW